MTKNLIEKPVGIHKIISETGMTKREILKHVDKGNIDAKYECNRLIFKVSELIRLRRKHKQHIGMWKMVNELLDDNSAFVINKPTNKKEFTEYLQYNNWFGVKAIPSEDVFFASTKREIYFFKKSDAKKMENHIALWLNSYGCNDIEKMKLLIEWIKQKLPKTGSLIAEFVLNHNPNPKSVWMLLDYLSFKLQDEILDTDEKILDDISVGISRELPLTSAKVFSEFMLFLKSNQYMSNGWSYYYGVRGKSHNNISYNMETFLKMAHIVFNEEMWTKKNLMQKALTSKKHANLWAFVSLHFICGWHSTDIARLPKPNISQKGQVIRELIRNQTYNTEDIILGIEIMLKNIPYEANKTASRKNVPQLKIFFPESLRKPLGTILTIAASWCDNISTGMPFITRAGTIPDIKEFFGEDFLKLCNGKRFSTRRANKAYLQGIEQIIDSHPGKAKGYMIAALARSHKGGIDKLPEVTEIYLKDANFTGYTPEFIAKEMFERGVFSFIPSIMLEIYSKEKYRKLHVSAQTEMITNLGISSTAIENVAELTANSNYAARDAVRRIISKPEEIRGSISEILQNIASGNAASKQAGCMCLLTAANYSCSEPERSSCIGCGYEIYTKAIIRYLTNEYKRLIKRKKNCSQQEAMRCSMILKSVLMPALTEIITLIKQIYPAYNAVQIMEGVLKDVTNKNEYDI